MDPNRTIKTTTSGRRAAAARDGRLERGQEPTRPIMPSSEATAAAVGHTPGPWHVGRTKNGTLRIVAGTVLVAADVGTVGEADEEANAAVLAAAPALLSALDDLLRETSGGQAPCGACFAEAARAAIAQARGRS